MKPSNLKAPFSWDECKPMIHDRILYAPLTLAPTEELHFPGWEDPSLFGNDHPICIEYCSGNGLWIAAKAEANPNINWVAVEKKFMRVKKIWSKIKNLDLKNLIVVCGEAYETTRRYFPLESFSNAYINFPDPWPKRRHAKLRLIQPRFTDEVCRVLKPGAIFSLVTDDADYSQKMLQEMNGHSGFESCYPSPYYVTELEGYGTSYFEELWREQGRIIHYHQFICKKT
jgi:tRNA (guanine-N7-)-methyltransferase